MHLIRIPAVLLLFLVCTVTFEQSCTAQPGDSPGTFPKYKWVYLINNLDTPSKLLEAKKLATEAQAHGLNGIVLTAYVDTITSWPESRKNNLKDFKRHCDTLGIEIIPQVTSIGYGYAALQHDPNLAAAVEFRDCPFKVEGGFASRDESRMNLLPDSSFENFVSKKGPGSYEVVDEMNRAVFLDSTTSHSGRNSIKLTNTRASVVNNARVRIPVQLEKQTEYEVSFWMKSEKLTPVKSFRAAVYLNDLSDTLYSTYRDPVVAASGKWILHRHRFFSGKQTSGLLYFGLWGAANGTVWVDDIKLIKVSAGIDVLKRPGTPLTVKSADRDIVFKEGVDYREITGLKKLFPPYQPFQIELTKNTRIKGGENLLVSGYSAARIPKGTDNFQSSVCMSVPELYDYWDQQIDELYPILNMKKAFLALDEIRAGGACELCKARNMTMAQILGDSVEKQFEILRKHDPNMKIFGWSDMFDPNANAQSNYFLAAGTFENSWEYVPDDLVMVCWLQVYMKKSLDHFEQHGFHTMGAPYFDRKSLDDTREWFNALEKTDGALGLMYVTWKNDYSFLDEYAKYIISN